MQRILHAKQKLTCFMHAILHPKENLAFCSFSYGCSFSLYSFLFYIFFHTLFY